MAFYVPQLQGQIPVSVSIPQRNPYGRPSKIIDPTSAYLEKLRSMTHHPDILLKNGFVISQLSQADVDKKKRCQRCNARCNNKSKLDAKVGQNGQENSSQKTSTTKSKPRRIPMAGVDDPGGKDNDKPSKPRLKCQYHTGRVLSMQWNCCRSFVSAPGCTFAPEHLTRTYSPHDLQTRYQFHNTPPSTLLDLNPTPLISFLSSDAYTSSLPRQIRRAVAIDCEMGVAFDGEPELIRLTLIDYFTSEILLDSLISPAVPMQNYNTRYSGVSRQHMVEARKKGKCLLGGYPAAREAVWRWVGPETIVIGHAVQNDLASLRWIHPLIVDSFVLATAAKAEKEKREEEEKEARQKVKEEKKKKKEKLNALEAAKKIQQTPEDFGDLISFNDSELDSPNLEEEKEEKKKKTARQKGGGGLSLKKLTKELLGRDIQVGKFGHDSLEDALASRDLVHWYVTQKGDELRAQSVPEEGFW